MTGRPHDRSLVPLALLEGATLLSGAGNGAAAVLLPWLVLERTGSAGSAGILAAATAIPLFAASLFSGTVVDSLGRRRTSIGSDVLSAVAVAAIPIVDSLIGFSLGWLVALAVVGALFDPAGVTARETMLPAAAARADWSLDRANGVHEAVWGVAFLLGPGLGGLLIAWVGAVDALWVTALGFTLSAGLVGAIHIADAGRPIRADAPTGMWHGTREGLTFVWRDKLLRGLLVISALLISAYMPIEGVLLPVDFEARGQPGRLGLIIMAMSAGGVAGALAYTALAGKARRSTVLRAALVLTGIFVVVLAALPPYAVMVAAAFILGLMYGPVGPIVNLAMQTRTPERLRGRVVGIITSADYAAGPVGYLVVGAAAQRLGVRPTFLIVAGLVLIVALSSLFVRSLNQLDDLPTSVESPRSVAAVLDIATSGPLPLVMPPRDPGAPT